MIAGSAGSAGLTAKRKSRPIIGGMFFEREIIPWLFILPVLGINVLVMLGPSIASVWYAFTDWRGLGTAKWVGLDNFIHIFEDPLLKPALINNVIWMGLSLFFPIALALLVAALLAQIRIGQRPMRVIFFIPIVVSTAVASRVWLNIYHPDLGLVSLAAKGIFGVTNISLLGNPKIALYLIYIASLWKGWGFSMILFLSAMQAVPFELYDAAVVDGANRLQQFRHVTLPAIRPTVVLLLVFSLIGAVLVFDFVFIMSRGGPGQSTSVIAYRMYMYAFQRFQAGYAASIGVMMTLWAALVTFAFILVRRRGWEV